MADFLETSALVAIVLSSLSVVGALLVMMAIVGGMLLDKKTMDRVSIRFTLAISVMDFIKALSTIFAPSSILKIKACTMLECLSQWTTLFYLFLNMAIAINLHLVFIKGKSFNPMWEKAYWIGAFALATLLSVIPIGNL
ncbi:hypothetical protein DSO57_1019767 [Entomophthora muscae]|uniref:Uncharacterized protein n=2 Tax=Entomophthora muscae TaxID=34485 RepID=A0ACC2RM63_9FUNG|nr:hypothetical protein DSO57_1007564 [Entomophthora muscae]KAJ9073135.1 hypothetical protein DSO57_1019767 [Entomophthora muscae]